MLVAMGAALPTAVLLAGPTHCGSTHCEVDPVPDVGVTASDVLGIGSELLLQVMQPTAKSVANKACSCRERCKVRLSSTSGFSSAAIGESTRDMVHRRCRDPHF